MASRSGIANNFSTNQPLEIPASDLAAGQTYRIVIAKSSATRAPGVPQQASRLRYVVFGGTYTGEFNDAPGTFVATYGHNSALNGNGGRRLRLRRHLRGAALQPGLRRLFIPRPGHHRLRQSGQPPHHPRGAQQTRLCRGRWRQHHLLSARAAQQHRRRGGRLSKLLRHQCRRSPRRRDRRLAAAKSGRSQFAECGGNPHGPAEHRPAPRYRPALCRRGCRGGGRHRQRRRQYRCQFLSHRPGVTLPALTINLAPAGLIFDPSASGGFPLTTGTRTGTTLPAITSAGPSAPTATLTLTFTSFDSGDTLNFGIERDLATGGFGNSADALAGATFTATTSTGTLSGTFINTVFSGYSPFDGFGFIDAQAAADSLP